MRTRVLVMAVVLAAGAHLLGATSADAQLSISRFTVDGGGGSSSGGAFAVRGTAGQLSFQLPEPSLVRAEVFDASGRLVRVLVDGFVAAGPHQHLWDRRDGSGARVPAGIYFDRFDASGKGSRQKVVVLS